jgi:hypothetical protein
MSGLYAYMMKDELIDIEKLLGKVKTNESGVFSKTPILVVVLDEKIACVLGDHLIYISEFIIAKVKGRISKLNGHPEITDDIFKRLPQSLSRPYKIIRNKKSTGKFLFLINDPFHAIAIEVRRKQSGKTEINTIYLIGTKEQRRLDKFPIA